MSQDGQDRKKNALLKAAFHPALENFGKSIAPAGTQIGDTAAGLVRIATAPFRAIIWGYQQVEERLVPKIIDKVEKIDPNDRVIPNPNIVGAALEASKFAVNDDILVDMFASLVASASHRQLKDKVHPAFINTIQQLSSIDAYCLSWLWKKYGKNFGTMPSMFPIASFFGQDESKGMLIFLRDLSEMILIDSIEEHQIDGERNAMILDNAERLGLIQKSYDGVLFDHKNTNRPIRSNRMEIGQIPPHGPYKDIIYHPRIVDCANRISSNGDKVVVLLGYGRFTIFGREFFQSVIE
jgi:hypothetical protein